MALGAVAIGYGEPKITRAVLDTVAQGTVSGLSHVLEVEVAERFCNVVPCAERVQFLKTRRRGDERGGSRRARVHGARTS